MRETDATEGGGLGSAEAAALGVVAIHGVAGSVVHPGQTSDAIHTLVVEPGGGGRCGDAGHGGVAASLGLWCLTPLSVIRSFAEFAPSPAPNSMLPMVGRCHAVQFVLEMFPHFRNEKENSGSNELRGFSKTHS